MQMLLALMSIALTLLFCVCCLLQPVVLFARLRHRSSCGSEGSRLRWRIARAAAGVLGGPVCVHARIHGTRRAGTAAVVSRHASAQAAS